MRKNLGLKLLVLFIALFLWFQQQLLKTHTAEVSIELQYQNLPDDLIIMPESAQYATATIVARGLDILRFRISKPKMVINASDFRYGKNNVDLSNQEFISQDNFSIQLNQIEHSGINWVTTDRLVTKEKPIKIVYASAKEEEFFLKNKINEEQYKVKIEGPLSLITEIEYVETEKITKRMVRDGFLKAKLISPDDHIELLDKEIVLQIMESKIINKTISLIPVQFPLEENVSIIPQKVTVMIRGPEDVVEKLNIHSIKAFVTIDKNKKADFADIQFELPTGVKLIDHTPQRIQIIYND